MSFKLPKFQSHRGYTQDGAQENTIDAFHSAKLKGFKMCELDVRLSKENIPVVFHDIDLKRIANDDVLVSQLTVSELKSKARISTLEEVITDSRMTEYVNIEIKSSSIISEVIEFKVSKIIKKYKLQSRVIISSFNPFVLMRLRYLLPSVDRALLVTQEIEEQNYIFLRKMWLINQVKPKYLNLDYRDIEYSTVSDMNDKGFKVVAWTVNDASQAQKLLSRGVESIITDKLIPNIKIS